MTDAWAAELGLRDWYMYLWGTKGGAAAVEDLLDQGGNPILTEDVGKLSGLGVTIGRSYDAVTIIASGAVPDDERSGFVAIVFWEDGNAVAARSSAGRWHPLCCYIFDFLCSHSCDGNESEDCHDGGDNPCHAFDDCCFLAWLLAHIFHDF